jgi:ABC-type transport system involved in cytochrome c biogenesis permease component
VPSVTDNPGVFVLVVLYAVPSVIARWRHHRNTASIIVLNLALGWTVIGWVGAMIWALYVPPRRSEGKL